MRKPVKISSIDLYIINAVRAVRKELGCSQRDVSKAINSLTDNNILGPIESNYHKESYTDEQLNKIANYFTEIAYKKDIEKEYDLKDFYPATPLKEELVDKLIM
jgi:transcriptional regulator with XRE-family HTH domain